MFRAMSSKFAYYMLHMSLVKNVQAQPIKQILINSFLAGLMLKKAIHFSSSELTFLTTKFTNTKTRQICNC